MNSEQVFFTQHHVRIERLWGNGQGQIIYEACNGLLNDGLKCLLGEKVHRTRKEEKPSKASSSSRNRVGHECNLIGRGIHMYSFSILVEGEELKVWEEVGR